MTVRDSIRRSSRAVILAVVLTFAFATGSALAANFTVTTAADGNDGFCSVDICTLRDAVIAANAASGSTINLPARTYSLTIAPSGNDDATTGDLNVTADTTITDRVFRVESGGVLELSGATIQHGHPAGGSAFPLSEGGGILALGALKLTDATVRDNFVETPGDQHSGGGAGIAQGGSAAIALTRVDVSSNQVNVASGKVGGGGGLMLAGGSPGSVTIADSLIFDNTAAGPGGGIYSNPAADGGSITITGTTISQNHAQLPPGLSNSNHAWGGGLATDGAIPVMLTSDSFLSNTADQSGGGIFDNGSSTYTITDSTIGGNHAVAGCTSCGVDFLGGGGIVADGGTALGSPGWTLSGDTIAGNTAGDTNHPNVPGGGIDEDGGDTFTIANTTIAGNTASGIGGGYESSGGGTHKLTNVTIDLNRAGSGGGNIDNSGGGTFTLANTIVSRGTPGNCNAALTSSHDHNLDSGNTCGFGGSDQTNADPKLGPLGSNRGPTLTEPLAAGSPAIDAGDNAVCPPTDQRGVTRPQNNVCDIGAYELVQKSTVTNANDSGPGSLRDAIASSDSGSTIDFSPALNGQTIGLTGGALTILHALTISGPGSGSLTINGNHQDGVFDVEAPNTDPVTISGLTITGGKVEGAGVTGGGGIFDEGSSLLTLTGVTVTGNEVTVTNPVAAGGGGVYDDGGKLTVTGSTITNNTATITGSQSIANGGGGIYDAGGAVTVTGTVVSGNHVVQSSTTSSGSDGGGGIYSDGGKLIVTGSAVTDNSDSIDSSESGSDGGGGIYNDGGTITLTVDTVNGNTFTLGAAAFGHNGGGGVYSNGGDVSIGSSSVDGNAATVTDTSTQGPDGGGGLFSQDGRVDVNSSSISANTGRVTASAGGNGGGAVLDEGTSSTYLNSTLSNNSLTVSGGGAQDGGGALNTHGGASLSDVTIAGNSINVPGGGIFTQGVVTLKNSIVAGNSAAPASNCAGASFVSAGFNLDSGNTCHFSATGDLTNTDPKLGPLQDNGGPTPTQALPVSSPAVDAGSCTDLGGNAVTTDQRGTSRPQPAGGKCDIGAFELVQATQKPPPPQQSPPAAQTNPPTTKTSTGATFAGSVNPGNQTTTYFFQYGLDPTLRPPGASTALYDHSTSPQSLPADSTTHAVSAPTSGLVPNARYHVRLVASNASGTTFGPDKTFTTPAGPAPPPPVLGQSQNVKPVTGHVFALINGQEVPLTQTQHLPSGTVLDTRGGSLELITAAVRGHEPQTGVFSGAIFKVTNAHNGVTTLSLVEGAFKGAPTYASCTAHRAGDAHQALSSRVLQTLRSRASGRFRTRGRYAAGTVRGTQWTTTDRCDGTLIAVQLHSVLVTDLVKHITVLVTAGHHYLAKPRK